MKKYEWVHELLVGVYYEASTMLNILTCHQATSFNSYTLSLTLSQFTPLFYRWVNWDTDNLTINAIHQTFEPNSSDLKT